MDVELIMDTILRAAAIYDILPYFWQVTLFVVAVAVFGLTAAIILAVTYFIRLLGEGLASLLSFGAIKFDETTGESIFTKFWRWFTESASPATRKRAKANLEVEMKIVEYIARESGVMEEKVSAVLAVVIEGTKGQGKWTVGDVIRDFTGVKPLGEPRVDEAPQS